MNFIGIDPSLNSTGLALDWGTVIVDPKKLRGVERLVFVRDTIEEHISSAVDLIIIEGYSYGSKGRAVFDIGELGGVLRVMFHESGIPWVEAPPSNVKKLATGNGNAKKEDVLAAAIRRLGYQGSNGDAADALWLRELARQHYGLSDITLPAKHMEALGGVQWPRL